MKPDLSGRVLGGRYRVIRRLGEGNFGTVYLAEDTVLSVQRAIKVLAPYLAWHQEQVEVFRREAVNAAAVADHPNIVTVYDFGVDEDLYFIVMQYCEGQTVFQRLQGQGPFAPEAVSAILAQIASALDFAHARGRIHRDIKPSNIMVGADGKATLLDFGLTKALEATQYLSRDDVIKGTVAYISPEQVRGLSIGPATDTYSLGMTVYQMLTGHTAFEGDQATQLYKHVHEAPAPMTGVAPPIEAVVRRAVEKEPAARWPSAGTFALAFADAVRGGAGVTAGAAQGPGSQWPGPEPLRSGRDWPKIAIGALLIVLALLALVFLAQALSGEGEAPPTAIPPMIVPTDTSVPPTATATAAPPTATETPSLRRTAAAPPTAAPSPLPVQVFDVFCDPTCDLDEDTTCTALIWHVEGVRAYYLSVDGDEEQAQAGDQGMLANICLQPGEERTFTIRVEWPDGSGARRSITISRED